MFVYTVYQTRGTAGKRPARRVDPISRVKESGRIKGGHSVRNDVLYPPQQVHELQKVQRGQGWNSDHAGESKHFRLVREQIVWERPTGELYIQNMLPLLLLWRCPKAVVDSDFIEKRHENLRSVQANRSRRIKKRQNNA